MLLYRKHDGLRLYNLSNFIDNTKHTEDKETTTNIRVSRNTVDKHATILDKKLYIAMMVDFQKVSWKVSFATILEQIIYIHNKINYTEMLYSHRIG